MRVYLPLTIVGLREAVVTGVLTAPRLGFAVTPALREWYASGDTEELEYAALTDAAGESLRLLAADAQAPPRPVLGAADVADAAARPTPDRHPAALIVAVDVPLTDVASVHVDDPGVAADVAIA